MYGAILLYEDYARKSFCGDFLCALHFAVRLGGTSIPIVKADGCNSNDGNLDARQSKGACCQGT
jgi:hypothetical protein